MTSSDISEIEQRLGLRLPAKYVQRMTGPGAEAAHGEAWLHFLFNDAKLVVERTIWRRDLVLSWGVPWKASYVVVTEINGGDSVIMDAENARQQAILVSFDVEHRHDRSAGQLDAIR